MYLAFSLIALTASATGPDSFSAHVVRALDGDTVLLVHEGKNIQLRLAGVDAPELSQSHGERARDFTANLTIGRPVRVVVTARDGQGRLLGDIETSDGRSVRRALVEQGLAWVLSDRTTESSMILVQFELDARAQRRGLWVDADRLAPWVYRHKRIFEMQRARLARISSASKPVADAR